MNHPVLDQCAAINLDVQTHEVIFRWCGGMQDEVS